MLVKTRELSNSYMPEWKMALTRKAFIRGMRPMGVRVPRGEMMFR